VVMESEIGDDCLIAAGTVITPGNRIPPRSLVRGVPGKVIRELGPDELKGLERAAEAYLKLGTEFANSCKRVDNLHE